MEQEPTHHHGAAGRNWAEAEAAFERAIALNPSYSVGHQWYANYLTARGRFDEAVAAMRHAQEVDPLSLVASAALGWVHYYRRDYDAAVEQCRRTLELNPRFELAHLWADSPELDRLASEWEPSRRHVWSAALVVGVLLFWYVVTRFESGQINAVDFTIYYDRPCFQTVHGRPLFVEVSDSPGYSHRSELADHAYWGMLGVCSLYALHATPLWLHLLSAIAIVVGAASVLRIVQRLGGGGVLACAAALSFVLNDNTARTLNYGFHPEVLYACLIPWVIDAGLRSARRPFLVLVLSCVLVKEDAFLPLLAVSVALALHRFRQMSPQDRVVFLVLPTTIALANLVLYYGQVVPFLTAGRNPSYANFWGNYGDTPMRAFVGMCKHPRRVLHGTLTSGIFRTLQPHLFLPLVGWRWSLGIVPVVALYGASANDQVRAFGIYYAMVLVPFMVGAAATGALAVSRHVVKRDGYARLTASAILLLGALLVGIGNRGYSLRPWKAEIAAVPEALADLGGERIVLVQSGLFPHAGYSERLQLLTPETLEDPRNAGAAVLPAPRVGAYPFRATDLARLTQLPSIRPMPPGLVVVRPSLLPVR